MRNNSLTRKSAVAAFVLLLLGGAFSWQSVAVAQKRRRPAPAPRYSAADQKIVAAIKEKIKGDQQFEGQWDHISVTSKNGTVTLIGWAKGEEAVKAVESHARAVAGVKAVTNRLRASGFGVGCGPGQKPCAGSCIPSSETCDPVSRG